MDLPKTTRALYPNEVTRLTKLKKQKEQELGKNIKGYYFIIAFLLVSVMAYFAAVTNIGFLVFVFGTVAVFAFGFIVFAPYEWYKGRKKLNSLIKIINHYIEKNTIEVIKVSAKNIAVADEYEDEGDLYIIEYETDKVLFLWDYDYNLKCHFPCLNFEIYDDAFFKTFGKQIYPLSDRIKPVQIDNKSKWAYISKHGAPGHMQTEEVQFDAVVERFRGGLQ